MWPKHVAYPHGTFKSFSNLWAQALVRFFEHGAWSVAHRTSLIRSTRTFQFPTLAFVGALTTLRISVVRFTNNWVSHRDNTVEARDLNSHKSYPSSFGRGGLTAMKK